MPISTPSPSERNSSIELFRILSIFLVLVVHWNGWFSGGIPEINHISEFDAITAGQSIIESFSCICVNCFILISGYFGLKLKWKAIIKISILLLSVYVPFYLISSVYLNNFSIYACIRCFLIFSNTNYFVISYLLLLFFSPIFNSFIKKNKHKYVLLWTVGLVFIETYMDFIMEVPQYGFNKGYSSLHFIVIYMIGQCLSLYKDFIVQQKAIYWICGYLCASVFVFFLYIFVGNKSFSYSNPLVVISSICLFLPFTYSHFTNRLINRIASSSLAVFIIHCQAPLSNKLFELDQYLLNSQPYGIYLIISLFIIIIIFIACVIYDNVRVLITDPIEKYLCNKFENIRIDE